MARRALLPQAERDLGVTSFWVANLGYARLKPSTLFGSKRVAVVLHVEEDEAAEGHVLMDLAAAAQAALLRAGDSDSPPAVVVLDLTPLLGGATGAAAAKIVDAESSSTAALGTRLLKPTARALEKLLGSGLSDVTLIAYGGAAQVVLRLLSTRSAEPGVRAGTIRRTILIHPRLSAPCVNAHLTGGGNGAAIACDLFFESDAASDRRLPAVRHAFPDGRSQVVSGSRSLLLATALLPYISNGGLEILPFDADAMDDLGQTMWLSKLCFELSRQSKQHEAVMEEAEDTHQEALAKSRRASKQKQQQAQALPDDITEPATSTTAATSSGVGTEEDCCGAVVDGTTLETAEEAAETSEEVGALIVRGNRCVLVRSLESPPAWKGLAIPTTYRKAGEAGVEAAVRAVSELCDIDGTAEVDVLTNVVPPVALYRGGAGGGSSNRTKVVQIHLLYAVRLPPGPLEDADVSDDEDLYDWYTWPRAMHALKHDRGGLAMLKTMACALSNAAAAGVVPDKWGGIFGQEWTINSSTSASTTSSASSSSAPPPLISELPFSWRSEKPFHPAKLHAATSTKGHVLTSCRIEGIAWFVSRHDEQVILQYSASAGGLRVSRGPPWWDALPTSEWPDGLAHDLKDSGFWHDPYGDRQSELTIRERPNLARPPARAAIEAALEACLLTDAEFKAGPQAWDEMADPFLEADARRPYLCQRCHP